MKKITLLIVCLFTTTLSNAQWNADTAINTLVSNSISDDVKSITGTNGNTYTVFWKPVESPTNYELRIQILDSDGNQLLGNDGTLISNTIPMSTFTQQWSLTIDKTNNIYIGVTGTSGNIGIAFKLNNLGVNQWTSNGINLGTAYLVRLLPLESGDVIISKLSGSSFNGEIQKFNASGSPAWASPIAVESLSAPANMYELSNGDIICVYHKLGNGVTSTMYAQRFDSNGSSVWASATQLFASGNNTVYNVLYYGTQDEDVVYYSYKLAHNNRFDAYVQRINPDGTLPWGVTGIDFDTNQTNYEQEIQIANNSDSNYVWALCRYTDASQGSAGVYLQKFDKNTGARQLTDNAKEVYAISNPTVSPSGDFRLTQDDRPIFLTNEGNHLNINLLDENGDFVWAEESKPIATFEATKSRVTLNSITSSDYVITFSEDKGSGSQIFAQNFTDDELLSINENELSDTLHIINPINNYLTIKSNAVIKSVEVYNTFGQLVNKAQFIKSNEVSINSSNWSQGMYIINVLTKNGMKRGLKVLKK